MSIYSSPLEQDLWLHTYRLLLSNTVVAGVQLYYMIMIIVCDSCGKECKMYTLGGHTHVVMHCI